MPEITLPRQRTVQRAKWTGSAGAELVRVIWQTVGPPRISQHNYRCALHEHRHMQANNAQLGGSITSPSTANSLSRERAMWLTIGST